MELFSGDAAITRSFQYNNLRACPIDVAYDAAFDLASTTGFCLAVTLVLRLCPCVGLLWLAPVCTTFVFLASSKHRRCPALPLGDFNRPDVHLGNVLANRSIALIALCDSMRIHWALEQSSNSVMGHLKRFQQRWRCRPKVWTRIYQLGHFGAPNRKPVKTTCIC